MKRFRTPRLLDLISALLVLAVFSMIIGKVLSGPMTSTAAPQPAGSRSVHSASDALVAAPTQLGIVTDKNFRVVDTDEIMGARQAGIQQGDVIVSIGGVMTDVFVQAGPAALLTPLPAPPTPRPLATRPNIPSRVIPLPSQQQQPYVPSQAERVDMGVLIAIRDTVLQSNGQPVRVVVLRGDQQLTFQVTPGPGIHPANQPQPTPIFAGGSLYHF